MSMTAIVTGGSRGIGAAIVESLAKHGYDVAFTYNSNASAAELVRENAARYGVQAFAAQCDVGVAEQVDGFVGAVVERFGGVDLLVNNAGISIDALLMRTKESDFDNVLDVNLKGAFLCTKAVSRHMQKARSGCIINVSSVIGLHGNAGQHAYAASKAGLVGLTKSCAKELASRNVRVNAIAPGYIDTDMTGALSPEIRDKIVAAIPLGRTGHASDVADCILWLASAQYVTGQVVVVDGGLFI